MNVNQTVIQTPKIIVKIKRLPSKTVSVIDDPEYTEAKKAMSFVDPARRKMIEADGYERDTIQGIINQIANPKKYGEYTPKTKGVLVYENKELKDIQTFSPLANNTLQSFNFSLSKSDVNGSFSLNFLPEYICSDGSRINVYDNLKILDIVEIYEGKMESNVFNSDYRATIKGVDTLTSHWTDADKVPVFVGIIKSKKYVAQVTDGGIMRRVQVSGVSVAGLVSQFYLNFDTTAMSITKQFASDRAISNEITLGIAGENKPIKEIINKIWEEFCKIAEQGGENGGQGKMGTIAVEYLIEQTMGKDFFEIDDSTFKYPVANVMKGEQTQDFYSLINSNIYKNPRPVAIQMMLERAKEILQKEREKDIAVILLFSVTKDDYSAQDYMKEIGAYYDLPMISYCDALRFLFENNRLEWKDFSNDEAHPNPEGHKLVASMIEHYFKTVTEQSSESYTIPEEPKNLLLSYGAKMYECDTLEADELGSWFDGATDVASFTNGWTHISGG